MGKAERTTFINRLDEKMARLPNKEQDIEQLVEELALCFDDKLSALSLLSKIGVGPHQIPPFTDGHAEYWWRATCSKLDRGLIADGLHKLVRAAVGHFPGNKVLIMFHDKINSQERQAVHHSPPSPESEEVPITISYPEDTPDYLVLAILQEAKKRLQQEGKGRSLNVQYTIRDTEPSTPSPPPPESTPQSTPSAKRLTWLHVSDLHFGHGSNASKRIEQLIVCREILEDAKKMAGRLGSPEMVFITGDVAFSGIEQEYTAARTWIDELLGAVGTHPDRLFIVPGNHDIDRRLAIKSFLSQLLHKSLREKPEYIDEILEKPENLSPLWPKMEAFFRFAQDFGPKIPSGDKTFWTSEIRTPMGAVTVVGLNSTLLSFDQHDVPTNLAFGALQRHEAIQIQPQDGLLLVLHHHPIELMKDGKTLEATLQSRPHISFYGHVHRAGGLTSHPLGQGTGLVKMVAGAGHAEGDYSREHAYAWGSLSPDGLRYYPRVWSEKFQKFVADKNSHMEMNVLEEVIHSPVQALPPALAEWIRNSS